MKMIDIINKLNSSGESVKFRVRTDGGVIITEINGTKYTGATGNKIARSKLGLSLSEKQTAQLTHNVNKFIKGKTKIKALDDTTKKLLKEAQKQYRKSNIKGKITASKVKWHIKEHGLRSAREYLTRQKNYAMGYAYSENVEYLADYIYRVARMKKSETKVSDIVDLLISNKEHFQDEYIPLIYQLWYDVKNGIIKVESAIKQTEKDIQDAII